MNTNNPPVILAWLNAHPGLALLFLVWAMAWKGVALWKAAGLRQKYWFMALLIVNTLGILEIFYIFVIARKYKVEVVEG
ncbi:DUF5652 family protein [Candidatus Parcubacteria bacterium]|nr:DUF5652 family protein [Candidatus Parcubacteria bacterium]